MLVDTSGVFAALDRSSGQHRECVRAIEAASGPLLLSPLVLAELDYLVADRLGRHAADQVAQDVADGAYRLEPLDSTDVARAIEVMHRHQALEVGITDASLVVLAERHTDGELLSLDQRHFRVLTWGAGRPFTLRPADG